MKNSIKKAVWLRVAVIFFALVISGVSTIGGLTAINRYNASTTQATDLYIMALDAEKAHFSWVENLSSAINFDTEFTGSMDYTSCSLGNWLYQYRYGDNSGCPDHNADRRNKADSSEYP